MEKKKKFNGDFVVIVFNEHPYPPCVLCKSKFEPLTEIRDLSIIKKFPSVEKAKFYAEESLWGLGVFDYYKWEELNEVLEKYRNRSKVWE